MQPILPNFLYVGTGKAGTTWLFKTLARHPDIFLTPVKETNFFDLNYSRGIGWYSQFFSEALEERRVGEVAHRYLRSSETANRIYETLGNVKLLVGLREPADYVLSDYLFTLRNGGTNHSLETYVHEQFCWEAIDYRALLENYVKIFGADRILICDFSELGRDPQAYLDKVTDFLEVDRFILGQNDGQKVNAARAARYTHLSSAASRLSKWMKTKGGQKLIQKVKESGLVQTVLYKEIEVKPNLPEKLTGEIRAFSNPGISWIDQTFGCSLENSWYGRK